MLNSTSKEKERERKKTVNKQDLKVSNGGLFRSDFLNKCFGIGEKRINTCS